MSYLERLPLHWLRSHFTNANKKSNTCINLSIALTQVACLYHIVSLLAVKTTYLTVNLLNFFFFFNRCICGWRWHACNFWRTLWRPSDIWQCTVSLNRPFSVLPRVPLLRKVAPGIGHGQNKVFSVFSQYNFRTEIQSLC